MKKREITSAALSLPPEERLALADALIDSVEGAEDREWAEAWSSEIEARDAQGWETAQSWAEVRSEVLASLTKA